MVSNRFNTDYIYANTVPSISIGLTPDITPKKLDIGLTNGTVCIEYGSSMESFIKPSDVKGVSIQRRFLET